MIKDHVYNNAGNSLVNSMGHAVWQSVYSAVDSRTKVCVSNFLLNAVEAPAIPVRTVVYKCLTEAIDNLNSHD